MISWSAWSLATGSDAATDSDSASPEAATPDEAADPDTEETDVEAATGADQETSTTQRTTTSQTSPIEIVDIPAPILGEEVGYDLIISTSSRPAILNLDSGEIRYTEGSRATPLAVTGDWLIVRTANDRPAAFRLDDLAADPTQLPFSPSTWPQLIDYRQRDDGKAWFSVYGDTGPGLPETVLVDIASGAIVEEVAVPGQIRFYFGGLPVASGRSMIFSPLSGGVCEDSGSGFRFVADGRLIVGDARRALVEACDARLRCSSQWLDRETWQPIDLAVPDESIDGGILINGTDWLTYFTFDLGSTADLLNIVTGQRVTIPGASDGQYEYDGQGPAISADGRWMATSSVGEVRLIELETGRETIVDGLRDVASGGLVFVE
ncbi:MAG: hypothetical protein GY925_12855, partial [Actinomycetia bacterium]|nr:hypothetical protein [Actinomycetes bacterium]